MPSSAPEVRFTIPLEPVPKGRPRFSLRGGFPRAYTPSATRTYEEAVRFFSNKHFKKTMAGPLRVDLIFCLPIPKSWSHTKKALAVSGSIMPISKPDTDNLIKGVTDALNGIAYKDDSQVVDLHATKVYAERPCVSIQIEQI